MEPYDVTMLTEHLGTWMDHRYLEPISSLEGGWESWIQIDFPALLDADTRRQFDFRREFAVPGVGRLDWVINSTVQGHPVAAVEIKAQSPKYLNSVFIPLVEADEARLSSLTGFDRRIMLVAVIDQEVHTRLLAKGFKEAARARNAVLLIREV